MNIIKIKAKYLIDKIKPEFRDIPKTLTGEILLGETKDEAGNRTGWLTITEENLTTILDKSANPTKREDVEIELRGMKRHLRDLTEAEYLEVTGLFPYFKKWLVEGLIVWEKGIAKE